MQINVILDGPPGEQGGRFVAVEDEDGDEINIGVWLEHPEYDGYWMLCVETGHVDQPERGDDGTLAEGMFWPYDFRPSATPSWGCRACGVARIEPTRAHARASALGHMVEASHRRNLNLSDARREWVCNCGPCDVLMREGGMKCGPCQIAYCSTDYCNALEANEARDERTD